MEGEVGVVEGEVGVVEGSGGLVIGRGALIENNQFNTLKLNKFFSLFNCN